MPSTPAAAARQQKEIAKRVAAKDDHGEIRFVCGVDASYRATGIAHCSAVVMDASDPDTIVEQASTESRIKHPYIPGLFMLREAGPVLRTLERVKRYDLVMVDGHGLLHPRRCGLACYVGVVADKPSIGVAKSLLCGTVRDDDYVELGGDVLGYMIKGNSRKNNLYVSVGNKVSLAFAVALIKKMTKKGGWLPEPLRLADAHSKR